jgi:2-polyprenyl-6-methoxyphenol hydroxylase-like FAD-dependent oxidoreductase
MPSLLRKQAVVVGAGIGGLTAARVLADSFERVVVLERDALPERAEPRAGVPQGKHTHVLLAGGQHAMDDLFPGFAHDLVQAGAVPLRVGLDVRIESPGYDPFPQRDLGWDFYAQSRAQLELSVRQRLHAYANIELRHQCRVQACVARADGATVTGVQCVRADGKHATIEADLVIDASGRGTLTLGLLKLIGWTLPEETTIGVDLAYATAIFRRPGVTPEDWKGVICFPQPAQSDLGALLLPIEGERWMVTVARMHGEASPGDVDGFMACVQQLRTPTIYNALAHAKHLGEIARFQFPASEYRHYERLEAFPRGLLPLGDALCRFNPIYGQGMSVAAQEARALRQLLAARAGAADPLDGLAPAFFAAASALIESPWAMAAIPDFAHPDTRGERPADLEQRLKVGLAMNQLAAHDPAVHKLMAEVQHLLKPQSVYQDAELTQRLQAIVARDSGHHGIAACA